MTRPDLEEEKIDDTLQNAEEYRKLTFNYLIPLILEACEKKQSKITLDHPSSDTMLKFLKNKGFKCFSSSWTTVIEW